MRNIFHAHRIKSFNYATSYRCMEKARWIYGFGTIDLIWNVAPGSSEVSAWTVALIPILARAPRIMPHGNQRNCIDAVSMYKNRTHEKGYIQAEL
jgi:hypothetical protein